MASLEDRVAALENAVAHIAQHSGQPGGEGELQAAAASLLGPDGDEDEAFDADGEAVEEDIDATAAAAELAEAEGVDLSKVEGSGEDGRVLVGDVKDSLA